MNINKGDLVAYNSVSDKYSFETDWNEYKECIVLYQTENLVIYNINKFGIEIGFHPSRFIKIVRHAVGKQLKLDLD